MTVFKNSASSIYTYGCSFAIGVTIPCIFQILKFRVFPAWLFQENRVPNQSDQSIVRQYMTCIESSLYLLLMTSPIKTNILTLSSISICNSKSNMDVHKIFNLFKCEKNYACHKHLVILQVWPFCPCASIAHIPVLSST